VAMIRSDISTSARVYVQTAYGEPIVAALKDLGAHWDPQARCWWVGKSKRKAVEELLVSADQVEDTARERGESTPPPAKQDPDSIRLQARVRYKGRVYYQAARTRDGAKVRLVSLPDTQGDYLDFWAAIAEVELLKEYHPREQKHYGRPTGRYDYTTLGSIARFIREQKDPDNGPICSECGKRGADTIDLEDGCLKHERCCDIPR
jgi:hypothetical protein